MTATANKSGLIQRVEIAQATLDRWNDRPFKWGIADCVRLAACHLRRMGHPVRLPASGSYGSLRTAKRRLDERGFANLMEAIDSFGFDRIAPAMGLPGDLILWPSADDLGSLAVVLSNGRCAGFHEDLRGVGVIHPTEYLAAWRVPIP